MLWISRFFLLATVFYCPVAESAPTKQITQLTPYKKKESQPMPLEIHTTKQRVTGDKIQVNDRNAGFLHAKKGLSSLKGGNYESAIEHFTNAIALGYDTAAVYCNRGSAFEELNRLDEAINDYKKGITKGTVRQVFFCRGRAYLKKNAFDLAIKDFTTALEKGDPPTIVFFRGVAHMRLNNVKAALEDYDAAIKADPNEPNFYLERAYVHLNVLDDFVKAISDFDKALELNENDAESYLGKARALYRLGKHREFENCLLKAETINPKDPRICFQKGSASAQKGEDDKAVVALEKALLLVNENGTSKSGPPEELHLVKGQIMYVLGRTHQRRNTQMRAKVLLEMALKELSLAIKLQPFDPQGYELRAGVYRALGREDEAKADDAKKNIELNKISSSR